MTDRRAGAGTVLFGGSGFLGSAVLRRCPAMVSLGRTPPLVPNHHIPLASFDDLRLLDTLSFDSVVFLIGSSDRLSLERPVVPPGEPNAFDYHVIPLLRTLEHLKARPIRRFIAFSTVLLYDAARLTLPVTEEAPIDPYKHRYVLSKHLAEQACAFYGQSMPTVTLRLSNMYGPTPRMGYDLIHDLVRQLIATGSAQVRSRVPRRDFIHVDDVARAVATLLDSDATGVFNMGTGEMTSVATVVDLLQALSGCSIASLDLPVDPPLDFVCDITRLQRAIDWVPAHTIESGLRHTYETMKAYGV